LTIVARSFEQELGRRLLVQGVEFELADGREKVRRTRGDDHMAACEPRHKLRNGLDGLGVIHVVQDHEPRRVGPEPAQNRLDPGGILSCLFLRQIKYRYSCKRGEVGV
jgi:hypothetical protein